MYPLVAVLEALRVEREERMKIKFKVGDRIKVLKYRHAVDEISNRMIGINEGETGIVDLVSTRPPVAGIELVDLYLIRFDRRKDGKTRLVEFDPALDVFEKGL